MVLEIPLPSTLISRFLRGYDAAITVIGTESNHKNMVFGKEGVLYNVLLEVIDLFVANPKNNIFLHASVLLIDNEKKQTIDYVEQMVHRNIIIDYVNDFRIKRYMDKSSFLIEPEYMLEFFNKLTDEILNIDHSITFNLELSVFGKKKCLTSNFNINYLMFSNSLDYDLKNSTFLKDIVLTIPNNKVYDFTSRINALNEKRDYKTEDEVIVIKSPLDIYYDLLHTEMLLKFKLSGFSFNINNREFLSNYQKLQYFKETGDVDKITIFEDILERERTIGIYKKPQYKILLRIKQLDEIQRKKELFIKNEILKYEKIRIRKMTFDGSWLPLFDKYNDTIAAIECSLREHNKTYYPSKEQWFKVFTMPVHEIKVVFLGQDPYQNQGLANGLAFSVPKDQKIPPSLRNIYLELQTEFPERDYKFTNGDLTRWHTEEKIFLLNTSLTVLEGKSGSMMEEWKSFTDDVIRFISSNNKECAYILLGNHAKNKSKLIENQEKIILGVHPSPLSAHRGFFGSGIFKKVDEKLSQTVNWSI